MPTVEDIRVLPSVQTTFGLARKKVDVHQLKQDIVRFVFEHLRLRGVPMIKLGSAAMDAGYPDIVFSVSGKGCAVWVGKRDYTPESMSVELRKKMSAGWACAVLNSEQDFVKFMEDK